jgi:pimeloyl-ACP methyl ester carboxylesterase
MSIIGAKEQVGQRRVLLHGALASSSQLTDLGARLGGDVVRPDLDGHGARADAPYELDAFVDTARAALGAGGDLVGYSLGGYVSLATAIAHPDLVRRVVTIATKLAWTPEVAAAETRRLDYDRLVARAPAFLTDLDARHPGSSARAVLARTVAFMTGLGTAPPLALDRIGCPVLVVVGDADPLVTREECEEAVARLPQGRLAVLAGVGHLFEQMDLDVLAPVVADFLR